MTDRLGWVVHDVVVEDELKAGYTGMIEAILGDDAEMDAFLKRAFWNLSDERRATYKQWLRENKLRVIENYPHEQTQFPCQAIMIADGGSREFLGNRSDDVTFPDGAVGSVSSEWWHPTIGIISYAESTDEIRLLHQLAKVVLAGRREELSDFFENGLSFAERDLEPLRDFLPHLVYRRALYVTGEGLQNYGAPLTFVDVDGVAQDREEHLATLG